MDNEELEGVKFSEFPSATPGDSDEVVGLHAGDNARFPVANFILAIRQGLANIFVPLSRTINGKALNNDVTLTMDDISNGTTYAKTTAEQVAQIGTNEEDIDAIEGKIPSAASTTNQLADKAFVTDSITQGTAIFRGSFATKAALLAVAWQTTNPDAPYFVSNNDYAVVLDDETQSDECWRYIYVTGTGWTPQYKINESPLTQAQLDALNSGATAAIISSVADKLDKTGDGKDVTATFTAASTRANISTGEKLSVLFGKISKWFADLGTAAFRAATESINSGSSDLVESGAVYTGLAGKQDTITASGILKGDGDGGVSAATPGMDYQAPLSIDATPTANSTNPVQSGGVYTDLRTRVPVYGMGKNLLDNAYFVGGGSQLGDGVFPINQRGQAQYTLSSGVYTLDRWRAYKYSGSATVNLTADGLEFSGQDCAFSQKVKVNPAELLGKTVTLSALIDGNLLSKTEVMPSSFSQSSTVINIQGTGINVALVSRPAPAGWTNAYYVSLGTASTTVKVIKAAKLEFGTEQTLAHQENGVWVLNEIPDYGEELRKCQRYYFDTGGGMVITGLCNSAGTEVNLFCPTPVSMNSENFTATASIGWLRGEGTGWTSGYTFTTNYIRILKNGVDGMGVSKSGLSGQRMYGAYFTKLVFTAEP